MMSGIRGKDTKPEIVVRSFLHRSGLRFRLHAKLPGKPDLIFPRYRIALFVHGCFWHRHRDCGRAAIPKTRTGWWEAKFERNVARDRRNSRALRRLGWRVLTIWECETEDVSKLEMTAAKIKETA